MAQSPSTVLYVDANGIDVAVTPTTPLPTTSGGSGVTADQVQGNVASGATDVGSPVKVGGRYNTTSPTLADGQRGDLQLGTRGSLNTTLFNPDSATAIGSAANGAGGDSSTNAVSVLFVRNYGEVFNNTTWDRARGDTTGAWVKTPLSAGTDRSITTSGASQQVMAANTLRYKLLLKNDTAVIQYFNFGAAAVATPGAGNMALAANSYYEFTGYNGAINIISSGAASAITAREFP